MSDEDRSVIAIVSPAAGGRAMIPVLERLGERGADLLVMGDATHAPRPAATVWLPT